MTSALMTNYGRYDLAFTHGEGCYLHATDGRRYLDFAAGIAVNSLGHAHPHLVAALKAQVEKLWHTSNLYRIPEQERLAERLCAASFADRVFFCNSGLEAMEGTIKVARRYQYVNGHPERWRIITLEGAFHGRSLATIAAANNPKHMEGFGPRVDGFDIVAFGNLNELRAAITPATAAIALEPIQGEGGIRPAALDYLRGLRAVADEFGLLLLADEVQSGMGRTGRLFAHEWAGIAPDVAAVAKGLGGGFPIGAVLATEKAAAAMTPGTHGSTFGGNQLAVTAANAVLDVILGDGFMERVEKTGRHLWDKAEALVVRHPKVFEKVRGAKLMLGLKCVVPSGDLVVALQREGLLTVGAGDNNLRLLPPLIVEEAQIDDAIAIIDKVAGNWPKNDG